MHRLSLVPLPLADEPLGWYLTRVAAAGHLTLRDVCGAADLRSGPHDVVRAAYGYSLTDPAALALGAALGLDATRLRRMLPDTLTKPDTGINALKAAGIEPRRIGICPRCAHERAGAPRLEWLLGPYVACLKHRVLLADQCNGCRGPFALGPRERERLPYAWHHRPLAGCCLNPVDDNATGLCATPMRDAGVTDLAHWPDLLHAHHELNTILRTPDSAPAYLRSIQALCAFALRVLQPDDLDAVPTWASEAMANHQATHLANPTQRRAWPAGAVAAVLPTVTRVVAGGPAANHALDLLVDRAHRNGAHVAYRLPAILPTPILASLAVAALGRQGRQTLRLGLSTRRLPGGRSRPLLRYRAEHVPPLLPAGATDPIIVLTGRQRHDQVRRIASVLLVRFAVECTWSEAIAALGLEPLVAANAPSTLLTELQQRGTLSEWMHHVRERAYDLDLDRVDYRAQREALSHYTTIDLGVWRRICAASNMRYRPDGARPRQAAAWIWSQVTRSDPRLSAALRGQAPAANADIMHRYRQFCGTTTPDVRTMLIQYARDELCPALAVDDRPIAGWPRDS